MLVSLYYSAIEFSIDVATMGVAVVVLHVFLIVGAIVVVFVVVRVVEVGVVVRSGPRVSTGSGLSAVRAFSFF